MKKLLFIESNTTGTGMLAIQKARSLNVEPLFITNDPSRYKDFPSDCQVIVCDTNDIDTLHHSIKTNVSQEQIAGITTTSEFYIHTVSLLAERFDLPGNPAIAVEAVRNKASVRSWLKDATHLYKPWFLTVDSLNQLREKKELLSFPCIVKPVDDSGSNRVVKCETYEAVEKFVLSQLQIERNTRNQPAKRLVLIEEFVGGQEYSVEMFSFEGDHQLIGITEKTVGEGPYFVEMGHVFPAPDLSYEMRGIIKKGALEVLNTMGWRNGPVHLEIKLKDHKMFVVEMNGRLAGGMIPELIRYATGTDLLTQQIKIAIGQPPEIRKFASCFAGIRFFVPLTSGSVEVSPIQQQEEIKDVKINVEDGQFVEKATNAYGRLGHIIATHTNSDTLRSILRQTEIVTIKEEEGALQ
ncbi:ATP-grasp domain-containing protein [Fictibacillus norfolkensis]|uniref:ATP-grasp domain-containing protein n=1 Tax=Fictibacillus norfolkensis TaxID=2762233 RepID=A0ABR8SHT1_9BACL|nr:ATP-grasp domain-containing protein [Fictibacillus norfolkensis]MBD7963052.1 ATP-grasp domain-containing protein [Fictibacillus norfolkensis]